LKAEEEERKRKEEEEAKAKANKGKKPTKSVEEPVVEKIVETEEMRKEREKIEI
jgi:septal ring factor EnvC (AmiA/AmiB activator)